MKEDDEFSRQLDTPIVQGKKLLLMMYVLCNKVLEKVIKESFFLYDVVYIYSKGLAKSNC